MRIGNPGVPKMTFSGFLFSEWSKVSMPVYTMPFLPLILGVIAPKSGKKLQK
jgi:hypothetical protein